MIKEIDKENKINVKWMGLPSTLYRIEYKNRLDDSNWNVLTEYYNEQFIVREIVYREVVSNKKLSRFYRIRYID